jgi:hypothetical protein
MRSCCLSKAKGEIATQCEASAYRTNTNQLRGEYASLLRSLLVRAAEVIEMTMPSCCSARKVAIGTLERAPKPSSYGRY